jgi:hypothetical protein
MFTQVTCNRKPFKSETHVRTALLSMNTRKGAKYGKVHAEWCKACKAHHIRRSK